MISTNWPWALDSRPDRGRSAFLLADGPLSCSAINRRWGLGLETRDSLQPLAPHHVLTLVRSRRARCKRREAPSPSPPPLDRASTSLLPRRRRYGHDTALDEVHQQVLCPVKFYPLDLRLDDPISPINGIRAEVFF